MIPRLIEDKVLKDLTDEVKTVIILGARQVGKTTLVQEIERKFAHEKKRVLYLNCDTEEQKAIVNTTSLTALFELLKNTDFLFVDEAQRLDNPGLTIKIIHDNFPRVRILVTGSSSFEVKNKISDPMTGRYFDFKLYPLSFLEVINEYTQPNVAC